MKKFVATYLGSAESAERWKTMDDKIRKQKEAEGMRAWKEWAKRNEKSIVDPGSPLGKTKRTSAQGIADTRNEIAAYTIVQADSHEAAARLFEDHPHFTIFPGDSVEIMECLPMPGM